MGENDCVQRRGIEGGGHRAEGRAGGVVDEQAAGGDGEGGVLNRAELVWHSGRRYGVYLDGVGDDLAENAADVQVVAERVAARVV